MDSNLEQSEQQENCTGSGTSASPGTSPQASIPSTPAMQGVEGIVA